MNTVSLRCLSDYRAGETLYTAGRVYFDVDEHAAAFLMRDSPGSFEIVKPISEAPPMDKQIVSRKVKRK